MVDEHILNEIETQIEKATLQLFKQEEVFANIVQQCIGLGYDFASIQLIRSEEQIIEAVKGTDWAGKARHYLEPDPSLRDIQADICQTCRTEVIAGWDKRGRFDKWVYDDNNHQDLIRIFTPLILVQDDKGKNDQQWFNDLRGNFINHEVTENWFKEIGQNQSQDNGQQSVAEIFLPESCVGDEVKVIGTIEVGYKNPLKKIEIEEVIDLIKKVGEWALKIRETQLPCVLDKIAKIAMKAVEADGTSLHFLEGLPLKPYVLEVISDGSIKKKPLVIEADRIPYSYEVFSELIGRDFIRKSPPRKGGLGQKAIKNDQEKFVPDLSQGQNAITLKNYNQKAFDLGIKAIIIIPLIVEQYTGCLYFHFKKENPFDKRVISWLKLFHNRVEEAIRHGITYEHQRDRNTQLKVLHSVAQSLTKNLDKEDLLNQIAWSTLNLLAADTITIYRYIEANDQFLSQPARAGRLKFSQQAQTEIDSEDVPAKLVKHGKNVYPDDVACQEIFKGSLFAKKEKIQAAAGILLKVNDQIVGTLLINYRRPHVFEPDEKIIIETLAASAAIAIMNQQWLENRQQWLRAFSEINRHIKTAIGLDNKQLPLKDDKQLLNLIMQRSLECTGADLADIRLFDSVSQELVMEVWHPANAPGASSIRTKLGEGITGWVAQHRETVLVNDVTKDKGNRYKRYDEPSNSELCVPIVDQDRLVGVINLESYRKGAFDERDKQMLEALADQVVIAIQSVKNREQLVKVRALADLGTVTSSLIHRINSEVGAIRVWAEDIYDVGDPYSEGKALRIRASAERILQKAQRMQVWIQQEDKLPINIAEVVQDALAQVDDFPSNIVKQIELPDNLPDISVGKQQLTDVFDNLIRNAANAMPEGGTLSIGGEPIDSEGETLIKVWVKDTGIGISEEDRDLIFEPSYSMPSSGHGMGIGLWLAQTYIESLKGNITFDSEIGKGSQFTVTLPIN